VVPYLLFFCPASMIRVDKNEYHQDPLQPVLQSHDHFCSIQRLRAKLLWSGQAIGA
jgi:hypothetical protein